MEEKDTSHRRLDSNEEDLMWKVGAKTQKGGLKDEYSLLKQVKYHPTNCEAHFNIALFYFEKTRYKDSLKHFTNIWDIDSSYQKLIILEYIGDCLFECKDQKYEPVLEAYKNVLEEA